LRAIELRPGANGAVIAAREANAVDLVEAEQADAAMLRADAKSTSVAPVQAISNDERLSFRQYFVDPTVQKGADLGRDAEFLLDFACETALRGLAGLEPAAGQFPFPALVLQQRDPAALLEHAFY
jgi:hypothetical protein